jgi:hypothetical protein
MGRKFGGKCFFYSAREVPDAPVTNVELGGLDGFGLETSSTVLRDDEPNRLMRNRREGGWRDEFRVGETNANRSTVTFRQAGNSEWLHSRRLNDDQRT